MDFPNYTIEVLDSEPIVLEAFNETFTYEILGESESQVVLEITSELPFIDEYPYSLIRFEDENTYSVSLSDSISDLAGREFFVRTN
jgi:SET domain-containing protein